MSIFYKNIAKLVLSTTTAKLIGILSIPILTRYYSPSQMGVLSTFLSTVLVISPLMNMRYCVTIPLPSNRNNGKILVWLSMYITIAMTLLLLIAFIAFHSEVLKIIGLEEFPNSIFLIPIFCCLMSLFEIFNNYSIREKYFGVIARYSVIQSVFGNLIKILSAYFYPSILILMCGQIISSAGSSFLYLRRFINEISSASLDMKKAVFFIKYYKSFPIYRLPSNFFLGLASNMPVLYFASNLGTEFAGQLGLAITALSIPVGLIGTAVSQAFYGEISGIGKKNIGAIRLCSISLLKKMIFISWIPALLTYFFASELFVAVFGSEWMKAGIYASILSFYIVSNLLSLPFVNVLTVLNKNGAFLIINTLRLLIVSLVFLFSTHLDYGDTETLYIYSTLLAIFYFSVIVYIFRCLKYENN